MDRVVWRVDTDEAERFFEHAGYRARNIREPLGEAGAALLHHINRTFETEGAWAGVDWPALNPKYEAWKEARRPGRPKLVFDRILLRAAISRRALHIGGNELHYELDVPAYAEVHQDGAIWVQDGHTRRIPARPFVVETIALTADIKLKFIEWLERTRLANRSRRNAFSSVEELFA